MDTVQKLTATMVSLIALPVSKMDLAQDVLKDFYLPILQEHPLVLPLQAPVLVLLTTVYNVFLEIQSNAVNALNPTTSATEFVYVDFKIVYHANSQFYHATHVQLHYSQPCRQTDVFQGHLWKILAMFWIVKNAWLKINVHCVLLVMNWTQTI